MCGIIGIALPSKIDLAAWGNPVAIAAEMLAAVQNRGDDGYGLAGAQMGGDFWFHKASGCITELPAEVMASASTMINAQVRYRTSGDFSSLNTQPVIGCHENGEYVSVVHNGNLTAYDYEELGKQKLSDSWAFAREFFKTNPRNNFHARIREVCSRVDGAYSVIMMYRDPAGNFSLAAFRDPHDFRPLRIAWKNLPTTDGKHAQGFFFASEVTAFDCLNGTTKWRDIEPGEVVIVSDGRMRIYQLKKHHHLAACSFENAYFKDVGDDGVSEFRQMLGAILAEENADVMCKYYDGVPFSALTQGIGFGNKSQKIHCPVIIRKKRGPNSHKNGRTFIAPQETMEVEGVVLESSDEKLRKKFKFIQSSLMKLKEIILIDDSIVRGRTMKWIISQIRKINPHIRIIVLIAFPPAESPCFFGIAMSDLQQLAWYKYGGLEGVRNYIQADELRYLSQAGLEKAMRMVYGLPKQDLCRGCWTGEYPEHVSITVPEYLAEMAVHA